MNRIFERRGIAARDVGKKEVVKERIKIGVVGCSRGAGASFVATSLAYYIAQHTERKAAYVQVEDGKHDVYDALGMDKRFIGREFADFYALLAEGKKIKDKENIDEHINWALRIPDECKFASNKKCTDVYKSILKDTGKSHSVNRTYRAYKDYKANGAYNLSVDMYRDTVKLPEIVYQRLINNIAGDVVICDFGSDEKRELYSDMDEIICVIDPMPSKLLGASEIISYIKSMQLKGQNVIYIINKDNPGVNRRELADFLRIRDTYTIPFIDASLIYSSQYNCEIPAGNPKISKIINKVFEKIISDCLHSNVIFL